MRIRTLSLTVILIVAAATISFAIPRIADIPTPELPCVDLQITESSKVIFRAYAIGVQIYRWNGAAWAFVAPEANLYADAGYRGLVGTHYAGPTWESNSGSKVVAARAGGCTPDPTAIAWLKLKAVVADGPGIFGDVTYIHRLNTAGGLAPSSPGGSVGEVAKVPYTAEYYFYTGAR
jgi:hypothetical protein